MLEILGADGFHGEADEDGGDEQEKCDLQGVEYRALEDAVFTFAAFLLADGFNGLLVFTREAAADEIDQQSDDDADGTFVAEDLQAQADLGLA